MYVFPAVCELVQRAGELCQAGQRCLGEQHAQLISKQKEGISELRKRLQEAEAGKPPGTTITTTHRHTPITLRSTLLKKKIETDLTILLYTL